MQLSIFQLNLFANKYRDNLFPYLKAHDFDVLLFQEITGPNTTFGNIDSPEDNYEELKHVLGSNYKSELNITDTFSGDPFSYFANGIFYKKEFSLLNRREIFMHKNEKPFPSESKDFPKISRAILELKLAVDDKNVTFLTTHFAWGGTPFEKPHQIAQGEILLEHLKTVKKPFVFTGDFNIDPQQPTIQRVNQYTRNLIIENKVTNTLNPRLHSAKHMFPKGAAVDYVFVSDDIEVKSFAVVKEDISDHLGLRAELIL